MSGDSAMTDDTSKFGVAVVGCGTVGGATATMLVRDRDIIAARIADAHRRMGDGAAIGSARDLALQNTGGQTAAHVDKCPQRGLDELGQIRDVHVLQLIIN